MGEKVPGHICALGGATRRTCEWYKAWVITAPRLHCALRYQVSFFSTFSAGDISFKCLPASGLSQPLHPSNFSHCKLHHNPHHTSPSTCKG